jgi:hypothetical protein
MSNAKQFHDAASKERMAIDMNRNLAAKERQKSQNYTKAMDFAHANQANETAQKYDTKANQAEQNALKYDQQATQMEQQAIEMEQKQNTMNDNHQKAIDTLDQQIHAIRGE